MRHSTILSLAKLCAPIAIVVAVVTACGSSGSAKSTSSATVVSSSVASSSASAVSSDATSAGVSSSSSVSINSAACDALTTHIAKVVCMSDAFKATLTASQLTSVQYDWSNKKAKTTWSNFPTSFVARNGLRFGAMSAESLLTAKALVATVLSAEGYSDFLGTMAADDYLKASGGGSDYSSSNYYIAFIGTPVVNGSWMIQIGGHHMAYNITYLSGVGYPTPNHIGAEPKASFEINSATYSPMAGEGNAMVAMFKGLTSSELDYAYLSGQTYSDVLIGPDNGSGVLPSAYPSGSNRTGKRVSDLTATQQALVTAAVEQWVRDYPSAVSDALMADYTSPAAYADTFIAWAGTKSKGVDVDTAGTYMRIDGPRLWIELVCQNGVVIQGKTHYHAFYRDKTMDYGNSL